MTEISTIAARSEELARVAADRRRSGGQTPFAVDPENNRASNAADPTQPLRRKSDLASLAAAVLRGLGEFINRPTGRAPSQIAGEVGFQAQRLAQESPAPPDAEEHNSASNAYRDAGRRGQFPPDRAQRVDFEV